MSLRICLISSEIAPLAKTGGLADVTSALARHLHERDHDVRVFVPFYGSIETAKLQPLPVEFLQRVPIDLGGRTFSFTAHTASLPGSSLMLYLIECPPLYDRGTLYTDDPDEHLRFLLLTRAAIESCQRMGWGPDILHCNDWQTALAPLFLRTLYKWDGLFARTRTMLTIHNIGYQGTFPAGILDDIGIGEDSDLLHQDDLRHGHINFLKTGLLYADVITTVSPTYAKEIQTSEFGMGLEDLLKHRKADLFGILNGVDYSEWSPEQDKLIPHKFSAKDLSGKKKNKEALLKRVGLQFDETVPLVGIVSRFTSQKGFELLRDPLPKLLAERFFQLVVLGSGEAKYEEFFRTLQRRFPKQVHLHAGFDNELAHWIEAGADIFLMPSQYEPCGLNQMYSLRYGTLPIVRKTGGLADTVDLYNPENKTGNGFVFDHFNSAGVHWALDAALEIYKDRDTWEKIMQNAMAEDFSWDRQVRKYEDLYNRLLSQGA